jgi:hypothetical protein
LNFPRSFFVLLAVASLACGGETPIVAGTPTIEFRAMPGVPEYGAVDVIHLGPAALTALRSAQPSADQWHEMFPVRANDSTAAPMLGTYSIELDRLRFTPRFPPAPGNTYIANFDPAAFSRISRARLTGGAHGTWEVVAEARAASTAIAAVYPTSENVPMNLLKLYVQFTAPMSVGQSMEHVRVLDDSGKAVEDAFLIPAGSEELWNPDKTRLTLLFDPGRIKRYLRPNEERGLPLQSGRRYTIVIDSGWKDAMGTPLTAGLRKTLRVGAPDRTSPRPTTWRVTAPPAGSKQPVALAFPEPLDHALLSRMLTVRRSDGDEISGTVEIASGERRWQFTPNAPWSAGAHYIEVDTDLEDLAGNSIKKLFDMAPEDSAKRVREETVRVNFTVR